MSDVPPPSGFSPAPESVFPPAIQRQIEALAAASQHTHVRDVEVREKVAQGTARFWIVVGSLVSVLGGGGFVGGTYLKDVDRVSKHNYSATDLKIKHLEEKNLQLETDLKAANAKIVELEKAQSLDKQDLQQHKSSTAKAGHKKLY